MDNIANGSDMNPNTSSQFQRAAVQARLLAADAVRLAFPGGLLLIASWISNSFSPASIWPTFFGCNASALVLFLAALRSARQVSDWRRQSAGLSSLAPSALWVWLTKLMMRPWRLSETSEAQGEDPIERWSGEIWFRITAAVNRLGSRPTSLAALATFGLVIAFSNLSWSAELPGPGKMAYSIGGICLALAFGLLVMERRFAAADVDEWPEAKPLMLLARLPILTLALSSLALLLATAGYRWAIVLPPLLACLSMLVALEFLIRALIAMFSPESVERQPSLLAESLVAGGLRWPPRPFTALQGELRSRHGIDLRQIWAFTFVRSAFPAVATGIVIVGWLVSGLNEVPMTGRGIYERFGKPISVVHPGLHLGLPWPFGHIVPVENGVVHELATSVAGDAGAPSPTDAEGPAPEGANRLWDGTHVSETSQVIASRSDGKQSFQIVNMDIRFVYRIGLSDQAALDAAYRTADVPALMEATASRVLVHDFAVRTLDDVLGEQRGDMGDEIAAVIRADLDRLHTGIEVLAVVIEAIHPPAGAANAYHAVQAAEITAQALVARERGAAAQSANEAQLAATVGEDKATATAREGIAASDIAKLKFDAEQTGYQRAGQAFLTEAYFAQMTAGLGHAKALILDHRIGGQLAPTFDLRSMMPPIDLEAAGKPGAPAASKEVAR
jgi:regulator of protease activity HflC (stomatin/prohibitin superfamily)